MACINLQHTKGLLSVGLLLLAWLAWVMVIDPGESAPLTYLCTVGFLWIVTHRLLTALQTAARLENALRESEHKHRTLAESAHDAVMLMRGDRFIDFNSRALEMFGCNREQLLGALLYKYSPPTQPDGRSSREKALENIDRALTEGRQSFEWEHRREDDTRFMAEVSLNRVEFVGEALLQVIVRDITERKRAEKELTHSQQNLRTIVEQAPLGIALIDSLTGHIHHVNRRYAAIAGRTIEEMAQIDWMSITHPDDLEADLNNMRLMNDGKIPGFTMNKRYIRKDGSSVWVSLTVAPVTPDPQGNPRHLAMIEDITDRKETEQALEESERKYRELVENANSIILRWSRDGRIIFLNEFGQRFFGYSPEEVIGQSVVGTIVPATDTAGYDLSGLMSKICADPRAFEQNVNENVRRNGERVWIAWTNRVVTGAEGQVIEILSIGTDITKLKQAEESLYQSKELYRTLTENSLMGVWRLLPNGSMAYANPALRSLAGFGKDDDLNNIDFRSFFTPESREVIEKEIQKRLRGISSTYEVELVALHGERRNVVISASPLFSADGRVTSFVGTMMDITERKQAEMELERLKNYLADIIDSMPSMLVGLDSAGRVAQWNHQAEVATGVSAAQAIGKSVGDILSEFSPWIPTLQKNLEEHKSASLEKVLVVRNAERRFFDLMLYPLARAGGKAAVLRIEDATERAKIQELMVQTEKMMSLGGLAAGMAHEINNPLGIITQAAQNIERRVSPELPANRQAAERVGVSIDLLHTYFEERMIGQFLQDIREATVRAARIISNMLQFSRKSNVVRQPTQLPDILDRTVELAASDYDLKKNYDFRSIEIVKEYDPSLPDVPTVAAEIEQVTLNLLKNSGQALVTNPPARRPRIVLRTRREGQYGVIEVEDNGPGMEETVRRRVFEPFFTTKEPGVGTGLGLSVSYTIVTVNHKGFMSVDSEPGRGSRFTVQLPLTQEG